MARGVTSVPVWWIDFPRSIQVRRHGGFGAVLVSLSGRLWFHNHKVLHNDIASQVQVFGDVLAVLAGWTQRPGPRQVTVFRSPREEAPPPAAGSDQPRDHGTPPGGRCWRTVVRGTGAHPKRSQRAVNRIYYGTAFCIVPPTQYNIKNIYIIYSIIFAVS